MQGKQSSLNSRNPFLLMSCRVHCWELYKPVCLLGVLLSKESTNDSKHILQDGLACERNHTNSYESTCGTWTSHIFDITKSKNPNKLWVGIERYTGFNFTELVVRFPGVPEGTILVRCPNIIEETRKMEGFIPIWDRCNYIPHLHFIGEKTGAHSLTQRSVPKVTQVVTNGDEI